MKQFMYFESTDGGMSAFTVRTREDLIGLYGWMRQDCKDDDEGMLRWMETAEVGDLYDHRLGYLVRLKDE